MNNSFPARCGRCVGKCACVLAAVTIVSIPTYYSAKGDNLDKDFSLPTLSTTATGSGSLSVQHHVLDPALDMERAALGPGFFSMQAAVPAQVLPVPAPEDEKPT